MKIDQQKAEELAKTMTLLHPNEDDVFELRILNTSRATVSGYFLDLDAAIGEIEKYIGKYDIYITLNSLSSDLFARSANRLTLYAKQTTSDIDIERINWILIDLDPVRKAGISSTDAEKSEAEHLAHKIIKVLHDEYGFPLPILCDSGNGYHILYKVNFVNTKETVELLKAFLSSLDFIFSTNKVEVDRKTFNPARIVKLYGTLACKGDDIPDRPHRFSHIINVPKKLKRVSAKRIQKVVDVLPKSGNSKDSENKLTFYNADGKKLDVKQWLEAHDIAVADCSDFHGQGIMYVLSNCPWREEHKNQSAYIIQFSNGAISTGCHHNSCHSEDWHSLRDKYEPGWRDQLNYKKKSDSPAKSSQLESILRLTENAVFIRNEVKDAFACVPVNGHNEIYRVDSSNFKHWISHEYFKITNAAFSREVYIQAQQILIAQAIYDGEEKKLHRRCAWDGKRLFYDLNNSAKEVIRITKNGWNILNKTSILFFRSNSMSAQATPIPNNSGLSLLDKYYRFKSDDCKILHLINLIAKFLPHFPRPIDVFHGAHGSSKSTVLRMNRSIVDPSQCDILVFPKDNDSLVRLFSKHYYPCFDNLSSISNEKSDLLCMAVTGAAFTKRKLYSDDDEVIMRFMQPISFTGINVVATRPELLDRSILLELDRIPMTERKTECQIWKDFEIDKPLILGAIFSILSKAIKILPSICLTKLGRMADFTVWGYAIAEAAKIGGDKFLNAYLDNQNTANSEAIQADPVASAVLSFMKKRKGNNWEGNASKLLWELNKLAASEQIDMNCRAWPKQPNLLSRRLKELRVNLEQAGLNVEINEQGHRTICLKKR